MIQAPARAFPERFLTRESQFCVLCFAQRKGWVRIANMADLVTLRAEYGERSAMRRYRARRRAAIVRHLRTEHPEATQ